MKKNILKNCKLCKLYDGNVCLKFGIIKDENEVCYHCVNKNSDEEIEDDFIDTGELFDDD